MAVIPAALDDAGIVPRQVDGLVKNAMEATGEHEVARALGADDVGFLAQVGYGGRDVRS